MSHKHARQRPDRSSSTRSSFYSSSEQVEWDRESYDRRKASTFRGLHEVKLHDGEHIYKECQRRANMYVQRAIEEQDAIDNYEMPENMRIRNFIRKVKPEDLGKWSRGIEDGLSVRSTRKDLKSAGATPRDISESDRSQSMSSSEGSMTFSQIYSEIYEESRARQEKAEQICRMYTNKKSNRTLGYIKSKSKERSARWLTGTGEPDSATGGSQGSEVDSECQQSSADRKYFTKAQYKYLIAEQLDVIARYRSDLRSGYAECSEISDGAEEDAAEDEQEEAQEDGEEEEVPSHGEEDVEEQAEEDAEEDVEDLAEDDIEESAEEDIDDLPDNLPAELTEILPEELDAEFANELAEELAEEFAEDLSEDYADESFPSDAPSDAPSEAEEDDNEVAPQSDGQPTQGNKMSDVSCGQAPSQSTPSKFKLLARHRESKVLQFEHCEIYVAGSATKLLANMDLEEGKQSVSSSRSSKQHAKVPLEPIEEKPNQSEASNESAASQRRLSKGSNAAAEDSMHASTSSAKGGEEDILSSGPSYRSSKGPTEEQSSRYESLSGHSEGHKTKRLRNRRMPQIRVHNETDSSSSYQERKDHHRVGKSGRGRQREAVDRGTSSGSQSGSRSSIKSLDECSSESLLEGESVSAWEYCSSSSSRRSVQYVARTYRDRACSPINVIYSERSYRYGMELDIKDEEERMPTGGLGKERSQTSIASAEKAVQYPSGDELGGAAKRYQPQVKGQDEQPESGSSNQSSSWHSLRTGNSHSTSSSAFSLSSYVPSERFYRRTQPEEDTEMDVHDDEQDTPASKYKKHVTRLAAYTLRACNNCCQERIQSSPDLEAELAARLEVLYNSETQFNSPQRLIERDELLQLFNQRLKQQLKLIQPGFQ